MNNEALLAVRDGNLEKLKELIKQYSIDINARDSRGSTLLHHAARHSHPELMKYLLEIGADILAIDNQQRTAFYVAVLQEKKEVVSVILHETTRVNIRKLFDTKVKGLTVLHIAVKQKCTPPLFLHVHQSNFLLEYGANYEIVDDNGKKPIDLADNEVAELLKFIDECFGKAKIGDDTLVNDLDGFNSFAFPSVMCCRNDRGHTLMQVLVIREHYELANRLLGLRAKQVLVRHTNMMYEADCQSKVVRLSKLAKECREFWSTSRQDFEQKKCTTRLSLKICCRMLEKAHEVFSIYRELEGKAQTITINTAMKNLEEILEVLGYDTERYFSDEEEFYYKNLPAKLKRNLTSLMTLIDKLIDGSMEHFVPWIDVIRLFHAVSCANLDEVQQLLNEKVDVNCDHKKLTPLCVAVEKGNAKIAKLLLKSGALISHKESISPLYLAVSNNHPKLVKLLLKNIEEKDKSELINRHSMFERTVLQTALDKGQLDMMKILLRYGAIYTPLQNLSKNKEIENFMEMIDECFHEAENGNADLVFKLKAMPKDEFMAVAGARNQKSQTIAVVATRANAKNLAGMITRMIKEAMLMKKKK